MNNSDNFFLVDKISSYFFDIKDCESWLNFLLAMGKYYFYYYCNDDNLMIKEKYINKFLKKVREGGNGYVSDYFVLPNNKKHGNYSGISKKTHLFAEYKCGKLHGKYLSYGYNFSLCDDTIDSIQYYKDDKKHGRQYEYDHIHTNASKKIVNNYFKYILQFKKYNLSYGYYTNDNPLLERNNSDLLRFDYKTYSDDDREPVKVEHLLDPLIDDYEEQYGDMKFNYDLWYDDDDEDDYVFINNKGEKISKNFRIIDRNGTVLAEPYLDGNRLYAISYVYLITGYNNGIKHGKEISFYNYARVKSVKNYKNGLINGLCLYYDKKGNIKKEKRYSNGNLISLVRR